MKKPKGILDIRWGDDAFFAASSLGLSCKEWREWAGGASFQSCFAVHHPVLVFGQRCVIRLISQDGKIEGIQLLFPACGHYRDVLIQEISKYFGLNEESGPDLYESWHSGELVRFIYDNTDDSCQVTVAGSHFGPHYARYLIAKGLSSVANSFRPK